MSSLLPGYEYDIFISYRHNDNLDGWVTDFVLNLEKELRGTLKDNLTIYFDKNPHDGLLETHQVDSSLAGKLKCLIFIPIISQTYCDPKSFAWQHEFSVFNRLVQQDAFGRDIKLANGNVSSRVLPVRIHDLDAEDKSLLEGELGGTLRAIDFIYKEAGVNRPLRPQEESPTKNQNQTVYRNQVNKVANAVKELLTAIQHPHSPLTSAGQPRTQVPKSKGKSLVIAAAALLALAGAWLLYPQLKPDNLQSLDKSIAVLPFINMGNDSSQNYFTDGMADDILNHLSKISDLRVKSRTSTVQYRNTKKTITEIANELDVANILEGSVRKVDNQVRIVVQLIDARKDVHIWSETYDRKLDDVLKLQTEIALAVSKKLQASLTTAENQMVSKPVSKNLTAYDYLLRARELNEHASDSSPFVTRIEAQKLLKKAIEIDPTFALAYAELSQMYAFDDPKVPKIRIDSAYLLANQAIKLDNRLGEAYYARFWCHFLTNRFLEAYEDLKTAYQYSPNSSEIASSLGISYYRAEKYLEGARLRLKSLLLQSRKNSLIYYGSLMRHYFDAKEYETVEKLMEEARQLYGDTEIFKIHEVNFYYSKFDFSKVARLTEELLESTSGKNSVNEDIYKEGLADAYYLNGDFQKAKVILESYKDIENRNPDTNFKTDFRHKLGYILWTENKKSIANKLIEEDLRLHKKLIQPGQLRRYYIALYQFNLGAMYAFRNEKKLALHYLDSALQQDDYGVDFNPMFNNIRKDKDFIQLYERKKRHWALWSAAMKQALREYETGTLK